LWGGGNLTWCNCQLAGQQRNPASCFNLKLLDAHVTEYLCCYCFVVDAVQAWLTEIGVDVSGLIAGQQPTPRAWQLFEEDGTRTQVCSCLGLTWQQHWWQHLFQMTDSQLQWG
jgi:hypothetical protein